MEKMFSRFNNAYGPNLVTFNLKIDAQGRGGGTSYTPSKDFKKFGHSNTIKHKNRGPLLIFCPKNPLKRI
jgi:hypothetical protein